MKIKKWEYIVRTNLTSAQLNDLGGVGWELCGVWQGKISVYYYLKRRIA